MVGETTAETSKGKKPDTVKPSPGGRHPQRASCSHRSPRDGSLNEGLPKPKSGDFYLPGFPHSFCPSPQPTHTSRHTHTQKHTQSHTHTQKNRVTHPQRNIHSYTHTESHTQTYRVTLEETYTVSHTHSHIHPLCTHRNIGSHTQKQTLTHTEKKNYTHPETYRVTHS